MTRNEKLIGIPILLLGASGLIALGAFIGAKSKNEAEKVEPKPEVRRFAEQNRNREESRSQETIAAQLAGQDRFSVCKMATLEFFVVKNGDEDVSYSFAGWSQRLRQLERLGYIKPADVANDYFVAWLPTTKATAAMNHQIQQEMSSPTLPINFGSGWGRYDSPAFGRGFVGNFGDKEAKFYRWKMVLGCREFLQIDGVTQLADGSKVDFSWHWKVTDLALLDDLRDKRERGEAYLGKSAGRLVIDKMYLKGEAEQ